MTLDRIYSPIESELNSVEWLLGKSLKDTANNSILEMNRYLLESPGKRIRPALVILSAYASNSEKKDRVNQEELIAISAAVELIHMASLIHDDTIDHAHIRHNKPSINSKWGNEVSIALGDYLYSKAFELIALCKNAEVLTCLAQAMVAMCEGELSQVKERDNAGLKKTQYIVVIKQKTASLMASCCRAGAASVKGKLVYKQALTNYGLNFGIAFQVMDDYLDITSTNEEMGKPTGLDMAMGELTLPLLTLSEEERKGLLEINKNTKKGRLLIKEMLEESGAFVKTRRFIDSHILKAKESLTPCKNSEYKRSLEDMADFIKWKKQIL